MFGDFKSKINDILKKIIKLYHNFLQFLPVRLFLVNLRRNRFLFLLWTFVFLIISGNLGSKYGIPSLFFSPEYRHSVNFLSYFLLGISFGIFFIAFHISGYISNAYLFPFLATVKNPFYKFSLNNFLIPVTFVITYYITSIKYQIFTQFYSTQEIILNSLGLFSGIVLLYFLSFSWFNAGNIDINILKKNVKKPKRKIAVTFEKIKNIDEEWKKTHSPDATSRFWTVKTYLKNPTKIKRAQFFEHYKPEDIHKVLSHNYKDALLYLLFLLIIIFTLGLFKETPFIAFPAAVSIMLLLSLTVIAFTIVYAVFKEWSAFVFIIFLFSVNFANKEGLLDYHNSAYGINYKYTLTNEDTIKYKDFKDIQKKDYKDVLQILNKRKQNLINSDEKTSIIFVNTAGGGLKASVWTYTVLSYLDSISKGQLFKHIQLISGASGGMLGAAYSRELYSEQIAGKIKKWYNNTIPANLSKDMLNPIAFSYVSSDLFFIFRKFKYNNMYYYKDRAYMFEKVLNEHTYSILDKPISEYKKPEALAEIPMIIFSPTEIENGRKVLISSTGISFMCNNFKTIRNKNEKVNIDFNTKYKNYGSDNLRFTTAIRMNASFPFVSPYVTMPGKDRLKLSDAGMNDNYGLSVSFQFLAQYTDWFIQNTESIIFININCEGKNTVTKDFSFFSDLTQPFRSAVNNYFNFQKMNSEALYRQTEKKLRKKIVFINFQIHSEKEHISVSWHLTNSEKKKIKNAIRSKENKFEIKKFLSVF